MRSRIATSILSFVRERGGEEGSWNVLYIPFHLLHLICLGRGAAHTAWTEAKAYHLLSCPSVTDSFLPLTFRRNDAALSISHSHLYAIVDLILLNEYLLPLPLPRCTRVSAIVNPHTVQIPHAKVVHLLSVISLVDILQSSLPSFAFPTFWIPHLDLSLFLLSV